jgi:hypothetical protein
MTQHSVPGHPMAPPPHMLATMPPPAVPQNCREKYRVKIDAVTKNGQYAALLAAQEPESPCNNQP